MSLSNLHIKGLKGQPDTIIDLKILHEAHGRELSLFFEEKRKGESAPLQSYVKTGVSLSNLKSVSNEIYFLLYSATHSPTYNGKDSLKRLQQAGLDLYNAVFPLKIKKKLAAASSRNLYLTIDDSLLNIPWELVYDGEEFFCLRFNMGRKVYTSHPSISCQSPELQRIRMLIIADPRCDLPKSYKEGLLLHQKLGHCKDMLDINLLTTSINLKEISRAIFEYHVLHYAGHAVYSQDNPDQSGWVLEDGILTAHRIMQLAGGKKPLPALIFSNACQSGQTSEWSETDQRDLSNYYAYDLVNAFLRSGVQHYIGTFQDIRDISSISLGLNFYTLMARSYTIGEALRRARLQLINASGEENQNNLIWAYYMLYGDPTTCYFKQIKTQKGRGEEKHQQDIKAMDEDNLLLSASHSNNGFSTRAEASPGHIKPGTEYNSLGSADNTCSRNAQDIHISKKLGNLAALGLIVGMILFMVFIKLRDRTHKVNSRAYNQYTELEGSTAGNKGTYQRYTDLEWEEKKWEIVERIMEKMRQRYTMDNRDEKAPLTDSHIHMDAPSSVSPISPSVSPDKYTLCIIPSNPVKKDDDTELLVEGLITFFEKHPKYIVVERERLDFVIRELELKTINLSEEKLHFSLGEIFDAQGILFVKVFEHKGRFPRLTGRKEAFLRLVDTKTTAIMARAEGDIDPYNLKVTGRLLGGQIISSLEKTVKDEEKNGQVQ